MISSISLPNWQHARLRALAGENINAWLYHRFKMLIRYAARSHMMSDRQMLYNDKKYAYKRQSVKWDAEMYNRLRGAAHRLRVSLSFLMHLILLEKDDPSVEQKNSYYRTDGFSRKFGLIFIERIKYPSYPPDT